MKKEEEEEEEEEESPPWMNQLIIGMGATDHHHHHHHDGPVIIKHEKPLLTAAQLNELKLQVMIYKYISAGLPLPSLLVLPSRESILASFDSFPFFSSELSRSFTHQDSSYINLMDPDSSRCRRTDGRKWRCKKNVITGQKYCEGHMHRGRHRSRKPVESSQMIRTCKATPLYVSTRYLDISTTSSIPENLSSDAKIMGTSNHLIATETMITSTVQKEAAVTKATWGSSKRGSTNNHRTNGADDKDKNCGNNAKLKNLTDRGFGGSDARNPPISTFQKFTFSPKSVLQVQACKSGCFGRGDMELEPGRCRRTDGKKWRCRRHVVPDEKYCKMHMHRGAKRRREATQSPVHLNSSPDITGGARLQPAGILPKQDDGNNLNTSLCISISTNAQPADNDNVNDSTISSSSDATISGSFL